MKTYHSFSSDDTKNFGELLAQKITHDSYLMPRARGALILALQGDLGAGKTTFTQGFFKGLGIKRRAISPTFVIMRRYRVPMNRKSKIENPKSRVANGKPRVKLFADVYHLDAYRLKKAEDLEVLEFGDVLSNPKNIILIEWPERVKEMLPKGTIWVKFRHGKKENERKITVSGRLVIRK